MDDARQRIPSLPGWPLIGNLLDIQDEVPIRGYERLIDACGPIARYHTMGSRDSIVIGSVAMLQEVLDESRFWKTPARSLLNGAQEGPRGLFSSESEDEMDWQQAHRTLMPAFGPLAIQDMFDEMFDIASQLVLKLARKGSSYAIPVTSEFTKLTLDTISLCAMGFRFNSFYQDELHPFVNAMNENLAIASDSGKVGSMVQQMMPWDTTAKRAMADRLYMRQTGSDLVKARRESGKKVHDLLDTMINGKDPKTGEQMSDPLIIANMVSFLVAGHETTSGLLSFAMYLLVTHPSAYARVQEEVDQVVHGELTADKLKDLHYINAVLRETLRLHPTAPAFLRSIRTSNPHDVEPLADGKYAVHRGDPIICLVGKIQRDPDVYGEDANEFRPERMLDQSFNKLPEGAWKPFGTGVRSCIGRAFAWQEAQICLALLFTYFDFKLNDPSYKLQIKQALTMKPEGLALNATLRHGLSPTQVQRDLMGTSPSNGTPEGSVADSSSSEGFSGNMTILYGSNTGTCQALAQRMGRDARRRGFNVAMESLNDAVRALPTDRHVIIITASYNGEPPDNADQFMGWISTSNQQSHALAGTRYAVFGCGHTDWAATYQRVPSLIDDILVTAGAARISERGIANAADGDIISDFDKWANESLWPSVGVADSSPQTQASDFEVKLFESGIHTPDHDGLCLAEVLKTFRLTADSEPEKRHMALQLPPHVRYETGDYLTVMPQNSPALVESTMQHFGITAGSSMVIQMGAVTFLPVGKVVSVEHILRELVELAGPASAEDIESCASSCEDSRERLKVQACAGLSLLGILQRFPSVKVPFASFLSMLKPMRLRYYSISSSSLVEPSVCSITYGVGKGVAGSYMRSLAVGDCMKVSVQGSNKHFRLPLNDQLPIVLVGAGTGLAPFHAFLQERAYQKAAGRTLAPALLLMGCRSQTDDRLYAAEIDRWVSEGVVDARYAFSRQAEASGGCKYVQDLLWMDRLTVMQYWREDAKVFVCGSPEVASAVSQVSLRMLRSDLEHEGQKLNEQEAKDWFIARRNVRFVVDTFA